MSHFDAVPTTPPDPIFGLSAEFKADPREKKYTLVTGYFRGEDLKTPVLKTVAEVETELAKMKVRREYLPIDGDKEFVEAMGQHVFGEQWDSERCAAAQTVGGTGALYLSGRIATFWTDQIGISDPTWINHWNIYKAAGLKTVPYPYFSDKKLQFEGMLEAIGNLPKKACVLLHTNCHNTSGADLSKDQWRELSALLKKRDLFPILDMAYQGFSGSPDQDAFAPRLFLEEGHELALTYTCAKNFSLYSERVGALFIFANAKERREAIQSQLRTMVRGSYSNPPFHGMFLVKTILKNPDLKKRWEQELEVMRKRMESIRAAFVRELMKKAPSKEWQSVAEGKGLFCYTELKPKAIEWLRKERGFYVAGDGRLNLTGLNSANLNSFVDAFLEANTHV